MFSNSLLNKLLMAKEQNQTPQFSRYCEINENAIKDVSRLVTCNDSDAQDQNIKIQKDQSSFDNKLNFTKSNSQDQLQEYLDEKVCTQYNNSKNIQPEVDSQFEQLKKQMFNIQSLATKQIDRLKKQLLQKDEQIGKLINIIQTLKEQQNEGFKCQSNKQIQQIGVNTENDYKDQQIKCLKQAVIRHIRINKQLTRKIWNKHKNQNNSNQANINSSITKLVSKIQI